MVGLLKVYHVFLNFSLWQCESVPDSFSIAVRNSFAPPPDSCFGYGIPVLRTTNVRLLPFQFLYPRHRITIVVVVFILMDVKCNVLLY